MKKDIAREIKKIKIIDTHEHFRVPLQRNPKKEIGLFELFANIYYPFRTLYYLRSDLISAGMKIEAWDGKIKSPKESYRIVAPFLKHVKTSSYFLFFLSGLKKIYGFKGGLEKEADWLNLDRKVRESYRRDDWEISVLKNRVGIKKMFYSYGWKPEKDNFFCPVLRMDNYLNLAYTTFPKFDTIIKWPKGWEMDHEFTLSGLGIKVDGFDDYLKSFDRILSIAKKKGTAAVKIGSAYNRSLEFKPAGMSAARKIFAKREGKVSDEEARKFENALMPFLIEKCIRHDLPIQFHTGFLAGNATPTGLFGINPLHLQNFIFKYPEGKFVLFHGGYPYLRETLVLGKKFPNVFLDSCWLNLISRSAARMFLTEALETVPTNKLMWGGDCDSAESICGAVLSVRQLLSEVLSEKVERREVTTAQAVKIVRGILHDNAIKIFKIKNK